METTRYFQHEDGALTVETTRWDEVTGTDREAYGRAVKGEKGLYQWISTSTVADLYSVDPDDQGDPTERFDEVTGEFVELPGGKAYGPDNDYWDLFSIPLMDGWSEVTRAVFKKAAASQAKKALAV